MRYDWILTGAIIAAALLSLWLLARDISTRLAAQWRRFLSQPFWFRLVSWAALIWIGLRLLRAGPRIFLMVMGLVGGLILWAAAAARSRRS